ncbi:NUDIX domain-containing protein [Kitasatospora sp. NPDC001540]|uniref:NUDIX domain-containing protein n=1 Tax=Kitasatospora sp. NPDC001540 TaxID=3364014 RepID=UPI00367F9B0D
MKQRVRAVLISRHGTALFMKRTRPGQAPYWVLVGGGVEDGDADLHSALLREIREEIAGDARIVRPFQRIDHPDGTIEHIFLTFVDSWDFAARTGPEFQHEGRGEYELEEVALTADAIGALNLLPPQAKEALREAIDAGTLLAD